MAILVFSPNGSYVTKSSLAAAATAADTAGKTVVVTGHEVVNTAIIWPVDRELRFEKGGYITFAGGGSLTGLNSVRPEDFGAVGDNSSDDSTAMVNAINAASEVVCKDTTYKCTSAVFATKSTRILGNGATLNFTSGGLSFAGTATAGTAISVAITAGSRSITITGSFAAGDLIEVLNNVDYSFSKHRAYYKNGEFAKVVSYVAGTLVVDRPLKAYPNTTTLVIKHSPIQVSIDTLKVHVGTDVSAAVSFEHTMSSVVNRCDFEGGSESTLSISRSYDVNIRETRAHNTAADTGLQYGLLLSNSSIVNVQGGDFYGTRHGVAMGGAGYSPTYKVTIDGATINSGVLFSADIHGGCSNIRYINNMILNGVSVGGEDVEYSGNTIYAPNIGVDYPAINLTELVGGTVLIERNKIIANQYTTEILAPTSSTFLANIDYKYTLKLSDNTISGHGNTVTLVKLLINGDNANTALRPSLEILNNTYDNDFFGLLRVLYYANINIAPATAYPEHITIDQFYPHATMASTLKIVEAAHSLAGCRLVLPSLAYNKSMTVTTGQYTKTEVSPLPYDYGTYSPVGFSTITNNSVVGGLVAFSTINLEAAQFTTMVTTGKSSDTFTANTPYIVAVCLGGQQQTVE